MKFTQDLLISGAEEIDNEGGSVGEILGRIRTHARLWMPTSSRIMHPNVRQNTGVDKDVSGYMKVWYWGGMGGSTDDATWELANP